MTASTHSQLPSNGAATPKNIRVTIRLTEDDKRLLDQKADLSRMTISEFMRVAALASEGAKSVRRKRLSASEGRYVALVLAAAGRLMDETDTFLEKNAHRPEYLSIASAMMIFRREIMTLRDACFEATGRQP